jgi:hypothetical protein
MGNPNKNPGNPNEMSVKTKQKTIILRNPNIKRTKSKLKSGKPKYKICEIQTIKKLFFFVWFSPHCCLDFAVLKFGFRSFYVRISDFLDFFENPENPNKRLVKSI